MRPPTQSSDCGLVRKGRYLEITYRKGKPIAAYLYLPRTDGEKAIRTEKTSERLLVDFAADGRAIGIEIPSPRTLTRTAINLTLSRLSLPGITSDELRPLASAA